MLFRVNDSLRPLTDTSRLLRRAAIIARLYYHTSMCLLMQINPRNPRDSDKNVTAQLDHAHQVCGILAHSADRGIASVAVRSLAIASSVLTDPDEQNEVMAILERINKDTGWKLGKVVIDLKRVWGWEKKMPGLFSGAAAAQNAMPVPTSQAAGPGPNMIPAVAPPFFVPQKQQQVNAVQPPPVITVSAPPSSGAALAPSRAPVNPLLVQADFSLPNHPYQNWYEPPNRSNVVRSQGHWPG